MIVFEFYSTFSKLWLQRCSIRNPHFNDNIMPADCAPLTSLKPHRKIYISNQRHRSFPLNLAREKVEKLDKLLLNYRASQDDDGINDTSGKSFESITKKKNKALLTSFNLKYQWSHLNIFSANYTVKPGSHLRHNGKVTRTKKVPHVGVLYL